MKKAALLALTLFGSVATAQLLPATPPATVGAYDVTASSPGEVVYTFSSSKGHGTITASPAPEGGWSVAVVFQTLQNSHERTRLVRDFEPTRPRFSATFHESHVVRVERSLIGTLLGEASTKRIQLEIPVELTTSLGPVFEARVHVAGERAELTVAEGERLAGAPARGRMRRGDQGLRLRVHSEDGWSVDLRAPGVENGAIEFRGVPIGDTTQGRVEIAVPWLNLRSEPVLREDTKVMRLQGGTQFEVVGSEASWRQVELEDGQRLWASSKYLRAVPDANAEELRLRLTPSAAGWSGTLQGEGPALELELVRRRRVLLVVDDATLAGYATRTWWYYRDTHGFKKHTRLNTHSTSDGEAALLAVLNKAAAEQLPYDRVVLYGHGGWDGPSIGDQFDPPGSSSFEADEWKGLVRAIKAGTTSDAKIYASACHAAGDNRHEFHDDPDKRWWTSSLGRATGRWVSGPAGKTSTEYALQQVQASLEGEGTVKQETLVTVGKTDVRIMPGRALDAGRTVRVPAKAY